MFTAVTVYETLPPSPSIMVPVPPLTEIEIGSFAKLTATLALALSVSIV